MIDDSSTSMDQNVPSGSRDQDTSSAIDLGNGLTGYLVETRGDSECPDYAYEGYEGCEGNCIWVLYYNGDGEFQYYEKCCGTCDSTMSCPTPGTSVLPLGLLIRLKNLKEGRNFSSAVVTSTPCDSEGRVLRETPDPLVTLDQEFEALLGKQFRTIAQLFFAGKSSLAGYLQVQTVADPRRFDRIQLYMHGNQLQVRSNGWVLVLTKLVIPGEQSGIAVPPPVTTFPNLLPSATTMIDEPALSASVVLREADGFRQYWVTIPESSGHPRLPFRYTTFQTPQWSVLLMRIPYDAAAAALDCGCGGKPSVEQTVAQTDVPPAGNAG